MLIPIGFFAASGGVVSAGSFDLLETQILTSSQASVTFSSLETYASTYQHLQIRATVKSDSGTDVNGFAIQARFNADTGSNYSWHALDTNVADGVRSGAGTSVTSMRSFIADNNTFGAGVIDILDPFETTKYTTLRGFGGNASSNSSYKYIGLYSGNWRNTAALTSITLFSLSATNFVQYSRFSLYGIKAS